MAARLGAVEDGEGEQRTEDDVDAGQEEEQATPAREFAIRAGVPDDERRGSRRARRSSRQPRIRRWMPSGEGASRRQIVERSGQRHSLDNGDVARVRSAAEHGSERGPPELIGKGAEAPLSLLSDSSNQRHCAGAYLAGSARGRPRATTVTLLLAARLAQPQSTAPREAGRQSGARTPCRSGVTHPGRQGAGDFAGSAHPTAAAYEGDGDDSR